MLSPCQSRTGVQGILGRQMEDAEQEQHDTYFVWFHDRCFQYFPVYLFAIETHQQSMISLCCGVYSRIITKR